MGIQKPENSSNFRSRVEMMGPLERRIMNLLWSRGELTVRGIHHAFDEELAYTTVMTTLDRLFKKGLLDRRLEGRAYYYTPCVSESEMGRVAARGLIDQLLEHTTRPSEILISCIIEAVTESDQQLLDEVDRLIRKKKSQLKTGNKR